jgi:hypothetical protein
VCLPCGSCIREPSSRRLAELVYDMSSAGEALMLEIHNKEKTEYFGKFFVSRKNVGKSGFGMNPLVGYINVVDGCSNLDIF